MFTSWPAVADDPKVEAAVGMLRGVIMDHYVQELARWYEVMPDEPAEWQQAARFGDTSLYVTAAELADLNRRVSELVDAYFGRHANPELRPPGARLVSYLHIAYPIIGRSEPSEPVH
jgi:hypothetical protein